MTTSMVEVVNSKGCSKLFPVFSSSIPSLNSFRSMEVMSAVPSTMSEPVADGPFTGLVICVTGLSKEARIQVMAATERLGGQYSSSLHPQCTHLVVQSCSGRKFEHALKHGSKNGLLVVTLGWFVDGVTRNVRLNESLYGVRNVGDNSMLLWEPNHLVGLRGAEKSCLPTSAIEDDKSVSTSWQLVLRSSRKEVRSSGFLFSNECIYIDSDMSSELKKKFFHLAWVQTDRKSGGLGDLNYPLISDVTKSISKLFGILIPDQGIALRGLFIIDKEGVIQHSTINNLAIGRSVDETLRTLQEELQKAIESVRESMIESVKADVMKNQQEEMRENVSDELRAEIRKSVEDDIRNDLTMQIQGQFNVMFQARMAAFLGSSSQSANISVPTNTRARNSGH